MKKFNFTRNHDGDILVITGCGCRILAKEIEGYLELTYNHGDPNDFLVKLEALVSIYLDKRGE